MPGYILEMIEGAATGTRYLISHASATIGRSTDCDICLDGYKGVSRVHVRAVVRHEGLLIQDLDSANGTFLNDADVHEGIATNGSVLRIGEVAFRITADKTLQMVSQTASAIEQSSIGGLTAAHDGSISEFNDSKEEQWLTGEDAPKPIRILIFAVTLMIALFAGLYIVNAVKKPDTQEVPLSIIRCNEKKIIGYNINPNRLPYSKNVEWENIPYDLRSPRDEVIKVKAYDGFLYKKIDELFEQESSPYRWYFWEIQGKARGTATITIYRNNADPIVHNVIVQGEAPIVSSIGFSNNDITPNEAMSLAKKLYLEGTRLANDKQLYLAIQKIQDAEILLDYYVTNAPMKMVDEYRDKRIMIQNELTIELSKLLEEMYRNFFIKGELNYNAGFWRLSKAKALVPDPNGAEWQILDKIEKVLQNSLKERK